jgi:hypothetical protein
MSEKGWSNFHNGVHLTDQMINFWLHQLRDSVFTDPLKKYNTMSSGDTTVFLLRWISCVEFIVANSSGVSKIVFYNDEMELLKNFTFNYRRPQ